MTEQRVAASERKFIHHADDEAMRPVLRADGLDWGGIIGVQEVESLLGLGPGVATENR